jgi:hypothetical protein
MTGPETPPPPVLRAPRLLYAILAGVSFALAALAWLLGGIDTALGALLGSALVAINLAGTVLFVRVVLRDRKYKALLLASNLVKFGLTMVVLYLAIVRFNISAIGIVTGLSSMLVASLIYAAARPAGS